MRRNFRIFVLNWYESWNEIHPLTRPFVTTVRMPDHPANSSKISSLKRSFSSSLTPTGPGLFLINFLHNLLNASVPYYLPVRLRIFPVASSMHWLLLLKVIKLLPIVGHITYLHNSCFSVELSITLTNCILIMAKSFLKKIPKSLNLPLVHQNSWVLASDCCGLRWAETR